MEYAPACVLGTAVSGSLQRGTPRGGRPDEIVRHSSRKCSNSQHQWLSAKCSGSGTGSQAGTTDGRPAANHRSKNNYGPSSHRCAWCWIAVWSKRRRHRQSEPRSRAGGNSGRREQASGRGSLTAHRPRWAAGPRGGVGVDAERPITVLGLVLQFVDRPGGFDGTHSSAASLRV